jgi:2-polyprenyl-6-hydroxyphenyl methylase/3-demethylubiquinone-9 3-methyltransferase
MPHPLKATTLHESGWKAHEADGALWIDPTNPQKERLSIATLAELGTPTSVRLLDFGCGNGVLSEFFQSHGYGVHAIDISETIVKSNQRRFPDVNFQLGSPNEPVPYADGTFDAVFCSEVIEHVYDVHFIFSEFSRLLRPGGLLILTTPYHGRLKNVIVALFFFDRHFDPTWQHIRFWTKKSLTKVCVSHGLTPVTWKHVGRFWPVPKSFFLVCRKA